MDTNVVCLNMPRYENTYYMHNCRYMRCIKQHPSNIWSSIQEKVKLSKAALVKHILFDKNDINKNTEIQTSLCKGRV